MGVFIVRAAALVVVIFVRHCKSVPNSLPVIVLVLSLIIFVLMPRTANLGGRYDTRRFTQTSLSMANERDYSRQRQRDRPQKSATKWQSTTPKKPKLRKPLG